MEQLGLLSDSVCKKPIHYRTEPMSDYYEVEQRPFARGKFATVRRCRHKETGVEYAAKSMRKRRRASDVRHEIVHEAHVLEMSSTHPHIVQLHEVYETATEIVLVLELVEGGELQRVLDDEEVVAEREATRLLTQILAGVSFLHDHNIAHLDIKPQNLLLTKAFPDGVVKLCDFGISRLITKGIEIREIVGTPDYVAPEVLHYEPISLATDMWSIGILTYVLLSGHSPFGGDSKQETFCNITRGTLEFPSDLFGNVSNNAKDFICKLLVRNPKERMSAEDCFKHPWLSGTDIAIHGIQLTLTPDKSAAVSATDSTPTTTEKESPSSCIQSRKKLSEHISPAFNRRSNSFCKPNGTSEESKNASFCSKSNGFDNESKNSTTSCNKPNGIDQEPKKNIPFCDHSNSTEHNSRKSIPFSIKFKSIDQEPRRHSSYTKTSIPEIGLKNNSPLYSRFNSSDKESKKGIPFCKMPNGIDSEFKKSVHKSSLCNKPNSTDQESKNNTTTRSVDSMVARFEGLSMSKRIVFSEEIIVDERVGMVY